MRKTVIAMMPKTNGRLKASVRAFRATKAAALLLANRIAAISMDINDRGVDNECEFQNLRIEGFEGQDREELRIRMADFFAYITYPPRTSTLR